MLTTALLKERLPNALAALTLEFAFGVDHSEEAILRTGFGELLMSPAAPSPKRLEALSLTRHTALLDWYARRMIDHGSVVAVHICLWKAMGRDDDDAVYTLLHVGLDLSSFELAATVIPGREAYFDEMVKQFPPGTIAPNILESAAANGALHAVRALLEHGVRSPRSLYEASTYARADVLQQLLHYHTPLPHLLNECLGAACTGSIREHARVAIAKTLLARGAVPERAATITRLAEWGLRGVPASTRSDWQQ